MTREERDKREAEKKARMEEGPDVGEVTLPFSRGALLRTFWAFVAVYPAWILWNARADLTFETVFSGSVLFFASVLPSWFWATGRVQGLPIYPVFGLSFLPTYVTPLWQGHSALALYTPNEINTAVWTVAGFLLVGMIFWQQMGVRVGAVPEKVLMIDLTRAQKVLMVCLIAEVVFEILILFFAQLGGGAFAAIRGFAGAAGRMGIFIFSYQIGQGKLSKPNEILFLALLSIIIVEETASLLLSTVIPTIGLSLAGFVLGAGRIPWRALIVIFLGLTVLHAGKYDMREAYLSENSTKTRSWVETPAYFSEWIGYGLSNLGFGEFGKDKKEDVSSAKDRASLIQLMIMIQKMTPDKVPYLEGETYRFIPESLIPRILNPKKVWAHTGNMIMSLQYGLLDEVAIWKTSVAFDLIMEAYANYGFLGVLILAVILGFFLGWVTRLTTHVPMLSFGFLYGVQVISACISSFNTAGVYVTTLWQSFLALAALSVVLMKKQNSAVYSFYAARLQQKRKALEKNLSDEPDLLPEGSPTASQQAVPPDSSCKTNIAAPEKHERPRRFIYGEKKK